MRNRALKLFLRGVNMLYLICVMSFLGLSLLGLVIFILKNKKEIAEELAASEDIEPSKIDKSQPYMPELGWY